MQLAAGGEERGGGGTANINACRLVGRRGGKDHVKKGERIEKKERDGDGGKRRLGTRTEYKCKKRFSGNTLPIYPLKVLDD